MRETLKHIFSNQITLEDNSQYYYVVNPYELKNTLGNTIAILQEYSFTRKDNSENAFTCKLYKTKDDSWYDIEEIKIAEKKILRMLKSAIDSKENNNVPENF